MSDELVRFILEAEDRASTKIRNVTEAIEQQVTQIKATASKTKVTTEIVGTLAATMGNSQLGSFAGQLTQVTERLSAFSEISKAGGAGALAFKAGAVAAAAVISVQVGKAIGDAIFQTEKWNRKLDESLKTLTAISDRGLSRISKSFEREKERIGLIVDTDKQQAAFDKLLAVTTKSMVQVSANIAAQKRGLDEKSTYFQLVTGWGEKQLELDRATIAEAEKHLQVLRDQRESLTEQNSEYVKQLEITRKKNESHAFVESLEREVELLKMSNEERQASIIWETALEKGTKADRSKIIGLLEERDAIQAKQKAEEEAARAKEESQRKATAAQEKADAKREAAAQKFFSELKRVEDVKKNAADNIRLEILRLEQGEQAARAMQLQMQGIDSSSANLLAGFEQRLAEFKSQSDVSPAAALAGKDSRLLTGRSDNPQKIIEANTRRTAEIAEEQRELLSEMRSVLGTIAVNTQGRTNIQVVGN